MGASSLWKNIRLTDKQGYTIQNNKVYTYDDDLREGYDYAYRVYAYSTSDVQGEASNIFSLRWVKPPSPPTQVRAEGEDARVSLTWDKENGFSYNIYRWEGTIYPLFPVNPSPVTGSSFTESKLQNGVTYKYEVRAIKTVSGIPYEGEGTVVTATPRKHDPSCASGRTKAGEREEPPFSLTGWQHRGRHGRLQRLPGRRRQGR